MASIRMRGENSWHVQIRRSGLPTQTKTLSSRKEAEMWARLIESEMDRGVFHDKRASESTTLGDVINQFANTVLPQLKSGRSDISRCNLIIKEMGHLPLSKIGTVEVARFRDNLVKHYAPATVKNFLTLLNRAMKFAQIDMGIFLPNDLPVAKIRMPKINNQRDRRLEETEFNKLMSNSPQQLRHVILFAIETAMRRSEIASLCWKDINFMEKYAFLRETKNGTSRKVPLSNRAFDVLKMVNSSPVGNENIFGYSHPDSITTAFTRACDKSRISNLRFHDLRHEATTRLFECGLNVIEAATVTGHKELRMLQRYTHLKPIDIAAKLNSARKYSGGYSLC